MGGRGSGTNPNSHNNLPNSSDRAGKGEATARGKKILSKSLLRKLGSMDPAEQQRCADVLIDRWYLHAKGQTPQTASWKAIQAMLEVLEGRPAQSVDMNVTNKTPEQQAESILESIAELTADEKKARVN